MTAESNNTFRNEPEPESRLATEQEVKRSNRQAFLYFGLAILAAIIITAWIVSRPSVDGTLKPLRQVLDINEKVNKSLKSDDHLAPEYAKEKAVKKARVNGDLGLSDPSDTDGWRLYVVNFKNGNRDTISFTLNDIKKLPKTEVIFNFKCIEGWSEISHWGGVKLYDFLKYYKLGTRSGNAPDKANAKDLPAYMGLETPDEEYYVGIDMKSALHPQTILCYELNGKPLPVDQGAPLRLIIPVKYGVKHLKRIGTIFFSDKKPRDYWYEQGYDYDAAL